MSNDDAAGPWKYALEVAGATAGLAALIYIVGASTMWVRLKAAGIQPDTALEHMSQRRLIALGLRGLLLVALFVAVVALVTLAAHRIGKSTWWKGKAADPPRRKAKKAHKGIVCWLAVAVGLFASLALLGFWLAGEGASRLVSAVVGVLGALALALYFGWPWLRRRAFRRWPWSKRPIQYGEGVVGGLVAASPLILLAALYGNNWRLAVIIGVIGPATGLTLVERGHDIIDWSAAGVASAVMLVVAATGTWALFGIAFALVVSLTTMRVIIRSRAELTRSRLWLLVGGLAVAAAIAGVCWQVEGRVAGFQAVAIKASEGSTFELPALHNCLDYFGETDEEIFVAEMVGDEEKSSPCSDVKPTGTIIEIPSDQVDLEFLGEPGPLEDNRIDSPAKELLYALERLWSDVS